MPYEKPPKLIKDHFDTALAQHRQKLQAMDGQYHEAIDYASDNQLDFPRSDLVVHPLQSHTWWLNVNQLVIPVLPAQGDDGEAGRAVLKEFKQRLRAQSAIYIIVRDTELGGRTFQSIAPVDTEDLYKTPQELILEATEARDAGDTLRLTAKRTAYLAVSGYTEQAW